MKTNPVIYLAPIEPYKARYTELLSTWERRAFQRNGFRTRTLTPKKDLKGVSINILTGEVLDSVGRPKWALAQIAEALEKLDSPERAHFYFSDFFHPGLEALPYSRRPFSASAFQWAGTWDQYDFTRAMTPWMRPWEMMAMEVYDNVFVACELLKDLMVASVPAYEDKIHVVGLPFSSKKVGKLADLSFAQGVDIDCIYTSRWDKEKNPTQFLEVAAACPDLQFAIATGAHEIRGTAVNPSVQAMIDGLKNVMVYAGLSKPEYYSLLNNSKVQMNTALQDWVSFTLLEALSYDCLPLYPNFRAFPETFEYETDFLYRPFDTQSAVKQLRHLLESDIKPPQEILDHHDGTLDRIAQTLQQRR